MNGEFGIIKAIKGSVCNNASPDLINSLSRISREQMTLDSIRKNYRFRIYPTYRRRWHSGLICIP